MSKKHPLEKKVRRLQRRLLGIETIRHILRCGLMAAGLILLLLLVQRLLVDTLDVWAIAPTLAAIALVAGVLWAMVRRPTMLAAAAAVDERLKLRERISSGVVMLESDRRMEQAVVEDAQSHAEHLRVGEVFPYPFFRELKWLVTLGLIIAGVHFFLPPMRLLASNSPNAKSPTAAPLAPEQKKKAAEELKALKEQLAQRTETKDPLEIGELQKNLEALQRELEMKKVDPADMLAKVSKLGDKVAEKKQAMNDKVKDFQDLETPENAKFTKEIAKDMEAGRFKEAAKKMEELKDQIKQGKMSPQDQQKLSEEMKKLAEQMKSNPEMAEALKKAAQKMAQGEGLKALDDMDMAQADMAELAEALEQMQMLDQLEEKVGECKSGICSGSSLGDGKSGTGEGEWKTTDALSKDWKAGDSQKKGSGMGGPGQGMGGQARVAQDSVKLTPDKSKSDLQQGKILSMIRVDGDQIKGDSNINFDQAVVEYSQVAEDTIEREPMPKEYKNLVRDYFDAIKPEVSKPAQEQQQDKP